jgi:hypothetical protein
MYVFTCTCVYMRVNVYVLACSDGCVCFLSASVRVCVLPLYAFMTILSLLCYLCTHLCVYVYVCMYVCMSMYVCIHTYIHTYIHACECKHISLCMPLIGSCSMRSMRFMHVHFLTRTCAKHHACFHVHAKHLTCVCRRHAQRVQPREASFAPTLCMYIQSTRPRIWSHVAYRV